MNVNRVVRLLKLLQALSSNSAQDADGLAAACGISRRTVFRDLQSLREAGVPVNFDPAGDRYSIPGAHFLQPTNFTAEEALALVLLATQLGKSDQIPFYDAARRAALKISSTLPLEVRQLVQERSANVLFQSPCVNPLEGQENHYRILEIALTGRRTVWMKYDSLFDGKHIETTLRPFNLLFYRHSWYVVGRCSHHKSVRTFNVGRIKEMLLQNETFSRPKRYSLAQHFGNAWGIIPGPGKDQQILLRFKPKVAKNVAEVRWHRTQRCTFLEDGSLEFRATVTGLDEVSWWITGYGDQVEILDPPELRTLVADRAAKVVRIYAKA